MKFVISVASGRGKCSACLNDECKACMIPQGSLQMVKSVGSGRWAKHTRYCADHAVKVLNEEQDKLEAMIQQLTGGK